MTFNRELYRLVVMLLSMNRFCSFNSHRLCASVPSSAYSLVESGISFVSMTDGGQFSQRCAADALRSACSAIRSSPPSL